MDCGSIRPQGTDIGLRAIDYNYNNETEHGEEEYNKKTICFRTIESSAQIS